MHSSRDLHRFFNKQTRPALALVGTLIPAMPVDSVRRTHHGCPPSRQFNLAQPTGRNQI